MFKELIMSTSKYNPTPIDTSDVILSDELLSLTEKIAENVHDVWAAGRTAEGWTYGPVKDIEKKTTPQMVPYGELPESEKEYDRNTALETLKLIVKLGYEINKKPYITEEHKMSDNNGGYVFISYTPRQQDWAESTRKLLHDNDIKTWMAPYDIPAGSDYTDVINDALENCSCLLLLLTEASQASRFVKAEVERAFSYGKPIFSMQLEDLELKAGFKFLISSDQIVAVREIKAESEEIQRILKSLKACVGKTNTEKKNEDAGE